MNLRCKLYGHDWEICSHTHGTGEKIIVTKYRKCKRKTCGELDAKGYLLAHQVLRRITI